MEAQVQKSTVADPMDVVPTVGEELKELFDLSGKDISVLGIIDIESKEFLSSSVLRRAAEELNLDEEFVRGMQALQTDYKERKRASREQYNQMKLYYRKLKKVVPLLRNDFNDGIDVLDDIVNFFGLNNEKEVIERIGRNQALYRSKTDSDIDEVALSAWLRRGELDFYNNFANIVDYNGELLKKWIDNREWFKYIDKPDYFKHLPEILQNFGVGMIMLPYMSKTVYGAVEWINEHPAVMISDRDQDLATCWFTLFHEFGHVLLHEKTLTLDAVINESGGKTRAMQREREANKFANEYLFNGDGLRKYVFGLKVNNDKSTTTIDVSKQFNVHPMFAGYWMRKAQLTRNSFERIPISFSE